MPFRQKNIANHEWQKWLSMYRETLLDCGVPLMVLEDKKAWFYFLDHGYFRPEGITESIIDVDRMPKHQAEKLCLFLENVDSSYHNSSALNRLQFLLGRGLHAKNT